MLGYLVTSPDGDTVVIPRAGIACPADGERVLAFFASDPYFAYWAGDATPPIAPDADAAAQRAVAATYGRIVATRDEHRHEPIEVDLPALIALAAQRDWPLDFGAAGDEATDGGDGR